MSKSLFLFHFKTVMQKIVISSIAVLAGFLLLIFPLAGVANALVYPITADCNILGHPLHSGNNGNATFTLFIGNTPVATTSLSCQPGSTTHD